MPAVAEYINDVGSGLNLLVRNRTEAERVTGKPDYRPAANSHLHFRILPAAGKEYAPPGKEQNNDQGRGKDNREKDNKDDEEPREKGRER